MSGVRGCGAIGRADLLAAIGLAQTQEDRARIAAFLGFDLEEQPPDMPCVESRDSSRDASTVTEGQGVVDVPARARPSLRVWRVDSAAFTALADEDAPERPPLDTQGLTLEQVGRPREAVVPPRARAWPLGPALRRAIEQVARRRERRGEVDVPPIVDAIVRGEVLPRIPHEAIACRVPRLVVAFDGAQRLFPVWDDQLELCAWILDELGRDVELRECADLDTLELEHGDVLLVIGDLGLHADAALVHAWVERGRRLRARGVSTHALMVSPADRWSVEIVHTWHCIDCCDPTRAFATTRSRDDIEARRDRLLELLAWTVRCEPELVRAVRIELGLDLGTELDVWNHPDTRPHAAGLMLDEARRRAIMAMDWAGRKGDLVRVRELARAWHAGLPREIWTEELQALDSIAPGSGLITAEDQLRVLDFYRRVLGYLERGAEGLPATMRIASWARRATAGRVAPQGWVHPVWGEVMREVFSRCRVQVEQLPEGLTLEGLTSPGPLPALRKWSVWQVHDRLVIRPESAPAPQRGSLVVTMLARVGRVAVDGAVVELDESGGEVVLPDAEGFELSSDCVRYRVCREMRPEWAHAFGRDAFGLWATLRVGEAEQRMRWIVPGRFMMGSPDSEVGRYSDEGPQFCMTFTKGIWLADTPCTQAFWVAVMGSNQSHIESPRRPVEQVSWQDVQAFIGRLRERFATLDPGLPNEARWEYACRAGTTTATYAGDLNLRGLNDAPVLDKIAWYGGNSGHHGFDLGDRGYDSSGWEKKQYPHRRAATREVATRRANPWGLYDMLGNVWEWCEDTEGDYEAGTVADPRPMGLGQGRVSRGGSWRARARSVRAASRLWSDPGRRFGGLGFRLAAGQGIAPSPEPGQGERSDPAG